MKRETLALVLVLAVAGAVLAQQPPQVVIPAIVMEDQFERAHNVADHRGDVLVLIYGDRASANTNKALGERIHVHFHPTAIGKPAAQARKEPVRPVPDIRPGTRAPDVLAVPIASIGKVPGLVRGLIRGQMRSASPDVPVWLDFGDVMKGQFGLQAGVPNAIVLDTLGRFRYAAAGQPTPEGVKRLLDTIEALRREAVAPQR